MLSSCGMMAESVLMVLMTTIGNNDNTWPQYAGQFLQTLCVASFQGAKHP